MLEKGHAHDLEIKNRTPIFHVPEVIIDTLGQIRITTQTINLRPARSSRLRVVTSSEGYRV